jgi:hypothetical protein
MEFDNPKAACYCCTTVVVLVLALIGLYISASTVEPISYGLKYNKLSKNVDGTTVYEGGWFFIGPLSKFIQYPRTQQNIDFSDLPGSDSPAINFRVEGAEVKLHLSFQYQIRKDKVPSLYTMYTDKFNLFEKNLMLQVT